MTCAELGYAEWLALAERCEKATGPDRAIFCAIKGFDRIECDPHDRAGPRYYARPVGGEISPREYERFKPTASIDAITALIERELPPSWTWTLGQNIHHWDWVCSINNLDSDGAPYSVCQTRSIYTPELALCAAFCRAKAERAET